MRVTLTDVLLPRRVVIAHPQWMGMSRRQRLRVRWIALRMRGYVVPHRWVPAHTYYILDIRYTQWQVLDHFDHLTTAMPEDREKHLMRVQLYGELRFQQEAKRAAATFRVDYDI